MIAAWMVEITGKTLLGLARAQKTLLLFLTLSAAAAETLHANTNPFQRSKSVYDVPISINLKNVTVDEVFKVIESKTNYNFFYNKNIIDFHSRFDLVKENTNVAEVLLEISRITNLKFKQINSTINVSKRSSRDNAANMDIEVIIHSKNISGKVISADDNEPLPGVNIVEEGTLRGTITNSAGEYSLETSEGATLVFSSVGFLKREVKIDSQSTIDVTMSPDIHALQEIVVIGYGETRRITNTGAVSAIKAKEIASVPVASVQNALSGKIPGLFSQQRSGQPGRDASDFFIRGVSSLNPEGNQPLIIVDDIQVSYDQLQQININEIESVSILKDASTTAIYGIKGANGVLVIRTRRGRVGRPVINFRAESGLQSPVRKPKFLNAYQTALLVNEAHENDGLQPKFSERDLQLFRTGEDPYGHPDIDWYEKIFKSHAFQHNANIDISGGTEGLRYFISGGAFSQDGLVKDFSDPFNDVNNTYFYRRFSFRSNLDFDVSKDLNLRLDLSSRFGNINQPRNMNIVSEIYNFAKIHPYSAPFLNPNGTWAYAYDTDEKLPTINARLANGGYERTRRTDNAFLIEARQDLGLFAEGLSASAKIAYSGIEENTRQAYRRDFPTYHYDSNTGTYSIDPRGRYDYGAYTILGDQNILRSELNIQGFFNYEREAGSGNYIKLLALYNRQTRRNDKGYWTAASVPENFQGYTARVSYNYRYKYLLDFNAAYNGTDRFGKDRRYGLFPAVGLGYSVSEEPFFQRAFPFIQLLKIRTSYGLVGSDVTSGQRYLYKQVYHNGPGYTFGEGGNSPLYPSIYEGDLENEKVSWEKARKFDIGIDCNLFNNLSFTVDYFYDYRYDQLAVKQDAPQIIGIGISPTNIAKTSNQGFDGQVSYYSTIGRDLQLNAGLVFSIAKNKILYKAEAQQAYPWLRETGRPIGQPFGYTFLGFYTEKDIARNMDDDPHNNVAVPVADIPVQPGDLKYKDLNGDGIIDEVDKGPVGKPNLPNTSLGWSIGANYKGLSVNLLFQGSFNYSFSVIGTGIEPFKSQFQPIHLKRWTPETAASAEFPRLTTNPTTVNSSSAYMSDFWLIDAWYIRLKTVDIAYQVPEKLLPFSIKQARLFLNAYNLLTFTNYDKYQQDPEISTNTAGDAYFNQRVATLGVEISL